MGQASALRQHRAPRGGVYLPLPAHPAEPRAPRPLPLSPTHSTGSVPTELKPRMDASRSGKTTNLPATGNEAGGEPQRRLEARVLHLLAVGEERPFDSFLRLPYPLHSC